MNDFLTRAVAYLKASHTTPGQGAGATDPDRPVLTPFSTGVAIACMVPFTVAAVRP